MPRTFLPLLLLLPLLLAGDWPQWRGPKRDSVALLPGLPDRLPEKLPARWTKPIGGGYGGISVVGDRLYVMDRQKDPEAERVLCLEVKTGKTVWEYSYPVRYGKLDYGNGPRGTPTVVDDKVFTFGAMGHLHALDARNGKLIWSRDTVKEFEAAIPTWGHSCSPLYDGGYVIVQVGAKNGCLMSFAARTGKVVWRSLNDPPGYASPVLVGNEIHQFTPTHLVAVDRVDGKERWREPFEGITYGVSISDPVMADGVILASNYWSGSKAVRLKDKKPTVAWEGKQLSLLMSTPLVRGKYVYALDRFRGLKCIEMASGKVLWENEHVTPRDRNPQASLTWVGDSDRALILNTPGELLMVRLTPEKLIPLGKTRVVGKTWAHPAFAAGCIFARNDEEIVCVPLVKE